MHSQAGAWERDIKRKGFMNQQKNIKTILEQLAFYKKSHKNQTHYQLWQEGCHPEIISTVGMMRNFSACSNLL
jgi:hypothetical protein